MSKVYDKIILVVALLALGGGLAVYFMASAADPAVGAASAADNPYKALTVDVREASVPEWPNARPQAPDSPNEVFSLFTPPKIYLGPDGEFIFERPDITVVEVPTAGVELVRLEREPYRIQLEGYIEEDREDASKSLLLFYDQERDTSVRARVGEEKAAAEFKVLDFTIERVQDEGSSLITRTAQATILDARSEEEVVLTHGERLFEDEINILMRAEETGETFELDQDTETFEAGGFEYKLLEINLEQSSVTVEKQVESGEEAKPMPTFRLIAEERERAGSTQTTSPEPQDSQPDTEAPSGDLDALFGN